MTPIVVTLLDPCLVVMVGPAGSGKSTLAARLVEQSPTAAVVSFDALRAELTGDAADQSMNVEVSAEVRRRVAQRCRAGLSTVVDGCHTLAAHRATWLEMAADTGLPVIAVALTTQLEVCQARQFIRDRRVPADVVDRHHVEVSASLPDLHTEGFAAVHIVCGPTRNPRPRRVQAQGDLFHRQIPARAVYVGRGVPGMPGSRFANPHWVGDCRTCGCVHDPVDAVDAYVRHLVDHPYLVAAARVELAGADLACWCPLDLPCHADVLLDLVNAMEARR
jgi:predicted kinase